jgi:hypothetical protein
MSANFPGILSIGKFKGNAHPIFQIHIEIAQAAILPGWSWTQRMGSLPHSSCVLNGAR